MTESEFDIQTKIVREPLPPIRNVNPNISENLEDIIAKATEKDVNYRFQNCDEFIKAFEQSGYNYSPLKTVIQQPEQNKTAFYPQYDNRQPGTTAGSVKSKLPVILAGAGALVIILILVIYFATQDDGASVQKITTNSISNNTDQGTTKTNDTKINTDKPAEIEAKLREWIEALNSRSSDLGQYYADNVKYYGWGNSSRSRLLGDKRKFFDSWSYFKLTIEEPSITMISDSKFECIYDKVIESSDVSNGKVYEAKVQSRAVFEKFGNKWLITEESDPTVYYKNKNW
ncbi:MAG: hypothetical protein IAE90_12925 [Ignavibacteria bacterium]|nr:hypothetical protein [Ignavibacteria bacterium]